MYKTFTLFLALAALAAPAVAQEIELKLEMSALRCWVDANGVVTDSRCMLGTYIGDLVTLKLPLGPYYDTFLEGKGRTTIAWMGGCPSVDVEVTVVQETTQNVSHVTLQIGPTANLLAGPRVDYAAISMEGLVGKQLQAGFFELVPNDPEACSPGVEIKAAALLP